MMRVDTTKKTTDRTDSDSLLNYIFFTKQCFIILIY